MDWQLQNSWTYKLFIRKRDARKIWKKITGKADYEFSFDADFQVESYLRHQVMHLLKDLMQTHFIYYTSNGLF